MIEIRKVIRVSNERAESFSDYIAQEEIVEVIYRGEVLFRHAVSPLELYEWAVGYLYTNRVVEDLSKVKMWKEEGKIFLEGEINIKPGTFWTGTSGCGSSMENFCVADLTGLEEEKVYFKVSKIFEIFEEFNKKSVNFKLAGSLHSSAICEETGIIYFSEDIARHNSVDKVIGKALLEGKNLSKTFLLTSGRISSEIVRKALIARIPVIVSHSAPTTFAVDLAVAYGLTLVGFLRGKRCNIYSNDWRILIP
ncbi:MAG: formate dehydrogenase accessory sulfurtransferase FdhD [bacterium]|nr:formate dehydrogenase accessory sulfurtransferase FdhD [bacterium]